MSFSRKAYSETVYNQTTDNFIQCIENAFRHFGGVPETLVIDYVPWNIINVMCPNQLCGGTVHDSSRTEFIILIWAHKQSQ